MADSLQSHYLPQFKFSYLFFPKNSNKMKNTLLLGTRKGLLVYRKTNAGWEAESQHFLGARVPYACEDPRNGTWWAMLDHGHWGEKLHRSTDRGKTWEELEPPKYPEGTMVKEGVEAKTEYLWVLQPGLPSNPGRLYIGTIPGGLFQSDDNGDSWQLVEGLWNHPSRPDGWFGGGFDNPGIHSVIIDPDDADHIFVGISCAGVFETTDGGTSWHPMNKGLSAEFLPDPTTEIGQDPHLVAAAPSNKKVMWQQNHCGVYVSQDGSESWQNVSQPDAPANFGFPVSISETEPLTAFIVPAVADANRIAIEGGLCVSRTRDGGKTWEALRNGLPQENCYDIVFRHALDLTGNRLAFGTTTGNVFTTENEGDKWEVLGNYLPPVFSVRFGQ